MKYKNVQCLNCGHEQEVKEKDIHKDELGQFILCNECESSFDVELEVEYKYNIDFKLYNKLEQLIKSEEITQ